MLMQRVWTNNEHLVSSGQKKQKQSISEYQLDRF